MRPTPFDNILFNVFKGNVLVLTVCFKERKFYSSARQTTKPLFEPAPQLFLLLLDKFKITQETDYQSMSYTIFRL